MYFIDKTSPEEERWKVNEILPAKLMITVKGERAISCPGAGSKTMVHVFRVELWAEQFLFFFFFVLFLFC